MSQTKVQLIKDAATSEDSIIHDGDTNTKIRFPAADTISAETGGSERLRVDSSGRVGIGKTPSSTLDIETSSNSNGFNLNCIGTPANYFFNVRDDNVSKFYIDSSGRVGIGTSSPSSFDSSADDLVINGSGNTGITINSGATTSTSEGNLVFAEGNGSGGSADEWRGAIQYKHGDDYMRFYTNNAERMRINSAGKLFVNCTDTFSGLTNGKMYVETANGVPGLVLKHTNDNDGNIIEMQHQRAGANSGAYSGFQMSFRNNAGTQVGTITSSVNATAYNTSSDYRLKENVNPITNGITKVKNLIPKRFNFIADPSKKVIDGFIAHEVATVVPEAVTGEKDEMRSDSEIAVQQLDTSKLIPVLTAALKEAIAKIETLETKVAALEAA